MFASIRSYVLRDAAVSELAHRVEAEFADRIAAQPGFVWYALLDCGEGNAVSISMFREPEQAAASRELARSWTDQRLSDLDLTMSESLRGSIPVSRVDRGLLEPQAGRFARVRRYKLAGEDLGELVWRIVDSRLAERMAELPAFAGYLVFSSRAGELVSVSVFDDRDSAGASDEVAAEFVAGELEGIDIQREDAVGGGEIVVSRVTDALLQSTRA